MDIQIPSLLRIKPHALYKVGKYLRKNNFSRIALFYGEGVKTLVGQQVEISLDSSEIHVDVEETVQHNAVDEVVASAFRLPREVGAIVAVGGGVTIDYAKYAGFLTRLPVIAVPTAISNDGFASPGASLYVNGQRTSCKATIPFGVVIDTTVIQGSPPRFTYSGIGDLISKYSAIADWKLAYHSTGEPVNDFSVMISLQSVANLVNHPVKAVDDLGFLQLVGGALVMSGVAMEVSGSSRPASGTEHLISHAYDQVAGKPSMHGIQVGVASLGTMWLQDNPDRDTVLHVFNETGFTDFMGRTSSTGVPSATRSAWPPPSSPAMPRCSVNPARSAGCSSPSRPTPSGTPTLIDAGTTTAPSDQRPPADEPTRRIEMTDGKSDPSLEVLTAQECYLLLATQQVGRLGVNAEHYPLIFPVNYGLDHGVVVIRTGPGTKLAAASHANVTFEVDQIDQLTHTGWSVLVRGLAEEVTVEHRAELIERTMASGVQPWAPGEYGHWLRLIPHAVTGRRIVPGELPPAFQSAGYL